MRILTGIGKRHFKAVKTIIFDFDSFCIFVTKKVFVQLTNEIIKNILDLATSGYHINRIALELNMNPDELKKMRASDDLWEDVFSRAEYNYEQYMIEQLEKESLTKNSFLKKDVYQRLIQKHDKTGDNEIIIRRV